MVFLGILIASVNGAAQSVPPPPSSDEITAPATLKVRPATQLTFGKESAQFEQTALSSVLSKVGIGSVEHRGDAGASVYWICYTAQLTDSAQRLWITSDGEMGGRGTHHRLSAEETSAVPSCPRSVRNSRLDFSVALDKGPGSAPLVQTGAETGTPSARVRRLISIPRGSENKISRAVERESSNRF